MPPRRRPSPDAPHLVAKLGGSLSASPSLRGWLAALERYPHRLTLVPGGGTFADGVRHAQSRMGFSDVAAHEMALMAMEQYAVALADIEPGLVAVETPAEGAAAHRRGAIAIWRPVAMTRAAHQIPKSWDITSDSLAAWYAREAGADALLLIKSVDAQRDDSRVEGEGVSTSPSRGEVERRRRSGGGGAPSRGDFTPPRIAPRSDPPPEGEGEARDHRTSAQSIVDPCFPHYARGLMVQIAGPADLGEAGELFRRGLIPGAAFDFLTSAREQSIAS